MRTIPGPNVHSHQPVIDSVIDLGPYGDRETREWDGLNDRLTTLLPGLARHHCAAGQAGGLLERLQGGTFFGHVIEHVALELSDLAGIGRNFGRTRMVSAPSRYRIVVAYASEAGMKFLLEAAAELVEAVVEGTEFDLDKVISDARAIVSANEPGPSTGAILDAARERNVPTTPILAPSVWQLGYGSRRALIAAALTSRTSAVSVDLASAKHDTRCILGTAGLPVPEGEVVESLADANAAMKRLGAPVVVKPVDGNQGKGVTLDVSTKQEMRRGFNAARDFGPKVIVERLITGSDYRFFLVDGALVAASHRTPAHVVGDGEHTIEQLIEITNSDPRRGQGHDAPLTRLRLGGQTVSCLARAGYTPSSVPPAGTTVMLSQTANLSTGGSATDVTDAVHVEVRAMVERAARVIGLDVCGMDVVARRIDVPLAESGATIIEVNAAPGIRMHEHPSMGTPRAAGEAVLESLFPHDSPARIPVVAVTGTNGKTTTVRMVAHVMSGCGCRVGYTTTSGITIAGREVVTGDCTGPVSARTVLTDPGVDIAVLETARGGIVRSGLGWDYCDVAVVTNVTADHIGQDGIRSVEDIVHIKALVPERVRVGGTVVLNANDPASLGMRDRPLVQAQQPEFVLFSLEPENPAMLEHVRAGGLGYAMVDDWICEQRGTETTRLLHMCD
ncbi:MAG TPA: cyanophycin synthetase, partial [Ilumatobacteraceae bacterium]|nr:cyanophycin synthetase [Ilumatobacteraceae bacterium]